MCYTGFCQYENYYGECNFTYEFPQDAPCEIALEKARCQCIECLEGEASAPKQLYVGNVVKTYE